MNRKGSRGRMSSRNSGQTRHNPAGGTHRSEYGCDRRWNRQTTAKERLDRIYRIIRHGTSTKIFRIKEMKTEQSDINIDKLLPQFQADMTARAHQGKIEYGDKSFSRDPIELCREVQQECIDTANWAWILWVRLENIKKAIDAAK